MGRPARGCSTLGRSDFMRLPWPAARITTERGEVGVLIGRILPTKPRPYQRATDSRLQLLAQLLDHLHLGRSAQQFDLSLGGADRIGAILQGLFRTLLGLQGR